MGTEDLNKSLADLAGVATLAKAHVDSYTRKDGTYVAAHDDKRQAAKPKQAAAGKPAAAPAKPDHPNVIGHAHKLLGVDDKPVDHPADAWAIHAAGRSYSRTSNTGTSMHDGTPVRAFEHEETGHRVWLDDTGRVHADDISEVNGLREKHAAAAPKPAAGDGKPAGSAAGKSKPAVLAKKPAAGGKAKPAAQDVKSNNEDWGFHGEAHSQFLRDKHGPDDYYGMATEADHNEARAHAAKRFSETAHNLVSAGHFDNHDDARDYLDSVHGRHLHDATTYPSAGGDATKVPWLAKDVARYKKSKAKMT